MSKKTAKPAAAETDAEAPKKRSKLKLALFALVPLVLLGGGGYAGYAFYLAPHDGDAHAAEAGGEGEAKTGAHGEAEQPKDPVKFSAVPSVIAAETSFTHSWAIATMIRTRCGEIAAPTLQAASEAEAAADGLWSTSPGRRRRGAPRFWTTAAAAICWPKWRPRRPRRSAWRQPRRHPKAATAGPLPAKLRTMARPPPPPNPDTGTSPRTDLAAIPRKTPANRR